jgi:transcription-repair coupling factor (superfamily II helicase)
MPEEELERVMTDFVTGKYDVLVTTTIVQLGLDMPNVNTLIVDEADKLGLAQLYQLRGRIGRGINQAYAYFFFNRRKRLTPQALKRLKTIAEATELGSGFSIAVRDLEIRGAGNLLGVKQSGHIAAVGFDLYCRLLSEAVEELKAKQRGETGKKVKPEAEQPSISLPLAAHIPEEYVPDLNARLNLYHRMARISGLEEVDDLAQELRDRFGILPQPVENLLYVLKVKILATKAGISSVSAQGRQIVIKPRGQAITHQIRELLRTGYDGALRIGISQIRLDTRLSGDKWKFILEEVLSLLSQGKFQKN